MTVYESKKERDNECELRTRASFMQIHETLNHKSIKFGIVDSPKLTVYCDNVFNRKEHAK